MLNETKAIYVNAATTILGDSWRYMDKNDLILKYCETNNEALSNGYLSAIMCKYWHLIDSYTTQGSGAYDADTVYDWLTHCVQYAKKHQPWKKGGNLAGQKNGPDKAMNIYMKSMRQGFYQWSNSKKRAAYFTQSLSLDKMLEDTGDANMLECADIKDISTEVPISMDIKNLVKQNFNEKNYMSSFIIDGIVNGSVIDVKKEDDGYYYSQFNKKKLAKHLRNIDNKYCEIFSNSYDLPLAGVIAARDDCSKLSSTRVYTLMKNTLNKLSKDLLFLKLN